MSDIAPPIEDLVALDDLPPAQRARAEAYFEADAREAAERLSALPPLEFDEAAVVPLAESPAADAVRAMESAWEAAWGTTLAGAV